jgi:amino acid transporter
VKGFAYTYNSHGLGPRTGFLSGWLMVIAYGMVGPMIVAAFGGFASTFLESQFEVHLPWQLLSALFLLFVWGVLAGGVTESAKVAFIFLAIEVGVILALTITILVKGGADGLSLENFDPANSLKGIGGLGTGMLWGILMFIGFEAAATLGEEAKRSRRAIPAALFTAVIVIGSFYVLAAYGSSSGFGLSGAEDFAGDTDPWHTLAQTYWGGTALIILTIMASAFANGIAGSNTTVRVLFSMGRESILPNRFGWTSRNGVPQIALATYMLFSLTFALLVGAKYGPFGVWAFCGTLLGLAMVVIYISVSIAVIPYYLRHHRSEFSIVRHGIIPVVSVIVMLLPIYGQLRPLPPYPNSLAVALIPVWMIVGGGYLYYLHTKKPQLVAAMGRVFAADQPAATTSTVVAPEPA